MPDTITILLVDDHEMFIEGLTALLEEEESINIIGTGSNGREAIQLVEQYPDVDVLIMDIAMPHLDGITTARELKATGSSPPIILLTQNGDTGSITRGLKAGAKGYVLKTAHQEQFVEAIRTVAAGGTWYDERVKDTLLFSVAGQNISADNPIPLTPREKEVLRLILKEHTTNEIADILCISTHTVESHRKNMIQKLGVRSVAGLVKWGVENGVGEN